MRLCFGALLLFLILGCEESQLEDQLLAGRDEIPTCEELCPNDHSILKEDFGKFDYLSFANFGYRGIGRCRGHVIVSQKFLYLAQFDASPTDCRGKALSSACLSYAQEAIDKVMSFEVAVIKGFRNLYEFSSHPEIKKMLKREVRSVSNRYRAVSGSIHDESHPTRESNVFHEALRRVELNQSPYLGIYGANVGHHALLAYGSQFKNGRKVLCVRDPNIIVRSARGERCQSFVYADSVGTVRYLKLGDFAEPLKVFELYSDEEERVERYIAARKSACLGQAMETKSCKL